MSVSSIIIKIILLTTQSKSIEYNDNLSTTLDKRCFRASDSTYFVDIARVKKFILTYVKVNIDLRIIILIRSGMTAPDHADPCRPACRFLKQFPDEPEANADHATQVGCCQISKFLDRLQFPQYTVAYISQKTVAVVQAADESNFERLNCLWL